MGNPLCSGNLRRSIQGALCVAGYRDGLWILLGAAGILFDFPNLVESRWPKTFGNSGMLCSGWTGRLPDVYNPPELWNINDRGRCGTGTVFDAV